MIELSTAGMGHECLREGWSEFGVFDAWTTGQRAVLALPLTQPATDHVLKLDVSGIFAPRAGMFQRVLADVNGVTIGQVVCRGAAVLEFFVPAKVLASSTTVDIVLELPDARRPIDYEPGEDIRYLALRLARIEFIPVALPEVAGHGPSAGVLAEREALMDMQSLGINCEFGFLQRSVGAEPLGLFRWTMAPLAKVVPALENRLDGLMDPNSITIHRNDASEFIVEDRVYGFRHHSFLFESNGGTLEKVRRNEFLRLGLLVRGLLDELSEARKLFVYHDAGASNLADLRRLQAAINGYANNTLLWIVRAPEASLIGSARFIEPGLIAGYVGGFQIPVSNIVPHSPHRQSWLEAAFHAHELWRAGSARAP